MRNYIMSKLHPILWGLFLFFWFSISIIRDFIDVFCHIWNHIITNLSHHDGIYHFPLLIGIYGKAISPIFCYIWEFIFPSIKEVISYPNISVDFYNLFFSQWWCFYYLFLPSMVVLLIPHHSGIFFFATSALAPTIEGIPRAGFIQ